MPLNSPTYNSVMSRRSRPSQMPRAVPIGDLGKSFRPGNAGGSGAKPANTNRPPPANKNAPPPRVAQSNRAAPKGAAKYARLGKAGSRIAAGAVLRNPYLAAAAAAAGVFYNPAGSPVSSIDASTPIPYTVDGLGRYVFAGRAGSTENGLYQGYWNQGYITGGPNHVVKRYITTVKDSYYFGDFDPTGFNKWLNTKILYGTGSPNYTPLADQMVVGQITPLLPNPFVDPAAWPLIQPDPFQSPRPRYRKDRQPRLRRSPRYNRDFFIEAVPGKGVRIGTTKRQRPPKNTVEKKSTARGAFGILMFLLDAGSEGHELLQIMAAASGIGTKHRLFDQVNNDPTGIETFNILFVDGYIKNLDVVEFAKLVAFNEVEDRLVGRSRGALKRSADRAGMNITGLNSAIL